MLSSERSTTSRWSLHRAEHRRDVVVSGVFCCFPEQLMRYRSLGETRDEVTYIGALETVTPNQPSLYSASDAGSPQNHFVRMVTG